MQTEMRDIIKKYTKNAVDSLKGVKYSSFLGILVGAALTISAIDLNVEANKIVLVKIKNNPVGYLQKMKDYDEVLKKIKATDGEAAIQNITAERVKPNNVEISESTKIEQLAREELGLKMVGLVVYVDGKPAINLVGEKDVDKLLEGVKERYVSNFKYDEFKVLETNIKEKVTYTAQMIEPEKVLTLEEAVDEIVKGKGILKVHTVTQGDTLWDIAMKYNTSIEEIEAINEDINIDKLKLGQEIKLSATEPYLNFEIVAQVKGKEAIPYDTNEVKDSKAYVGVKTVTQKGKDGVAEVTKKLTLLNGVVRGEDLLKSVVVEKPVNKLVAVGTKARTYYAGSSASVNVSSTGQFLRPSRGVYSSYFGRRWGKQHTGVDIASPTGTPVNAADGGVVELASWNGSYGNCIIINHGGGYKTLYGHLSKIYVKAGQSVSKGQHIGNVGSTGNSTGPHLHFEVRKNGVPQNPLRYIK